MFEMNSDLITTDEAHLLIDELERRGVLDESTASAFEGMRSRSWLSNKQLRWVIDVAERQEILAPRTQNAWSNLSPSEQQRIRGREVPELDAALNVNRPLKPPGRR